MNLDNCDLQLEVKIAKNELIQINNSLQEKSYSRKGKKCCTTCLLSNTSKMQQNT